ncbi:hypothetical protein EZV62_006770 [Acer yangbiense]|uniref:Uncharacterized protein n=1 Tax=Acer yangbiense TaxID=1000413 RepID=A0A5C7I8H8_9ROSI|nr:hypothetical protein EZV62_006770 [Acer yangbiense]
MWLLSNKIDRQELKPGLWRSHLLLAAGLHLCSSQDIRWRREGYSFNQENGRLIISSSLPNPQISDVPCPQCGDHNSSFNTGVILSCIDCFFFGGELNLFEYGVSWVYFLAKVRGGTCTLTTSDPPEDILHRAYFLLKKGFVIIRSPRSGLSGQAAALEATSGLTSDIGVRHDVAKVAVEAVEMDGEKDVLVNLSKKTCTCKEFQNDLLSCSHALTAIRFCKKKFVDFCSDFYKTNTWLESYSGLIFPVGHPSEWNTPPEVRYEVVLPPDWRAQAGRPRKMRVPSAGEHGSKIRHVENGSLANIIKPNKFWPFPKSLVAVYIAQVLEGLVYLHEQGVIHRDIKGANILTTKEQEGYEPVQQLVLTQKGSPSLPQKGLPSLVRSPLSPSLVRSPSASISSRRLRAVGGIRGGGWRRKGDGRVLLRRKEEDCRVVQWTTRGETINCMKRRRWRRNRERDNQAFIYAHHGIYVGDGKVIHFTQGPAGQENGSIIISSSLPDPQFSDVPCPQCVRGGTCTLATSDPPGDILHRANILLENGFGDYDVFKNNCEDFAIYCKTGLLVITPSSTRGGQSGQAASFEVASGLIFSSLALLTYKFKGVAAVGNGVYYCYNRLNSDIGVRRDVAKVAVERLVPPAPSPIGKGMSIDQGIAYVLMLAALVLTYLIQPQDASSS